MALGNLLELRALDLVLADHRDSALRQRFESRFPLSPLEKGSLTENGTGPDLSDGLTVDLHHEDSVE